MQLLWKKTDEWNIYNMALTSSRREYYFFHVPSAGLFLVKIQKKTFRELNG